MRIDVGNDNQNWLNWGKLVHAWIHNTSPRPTTVGELRAQLKEHQVVATVQGDDSRRVTIMRYTSPGDPLMLVLPTPQMCDDRLKNVKEGQYPLPLFYDLAFGGATRANLSRSQADDFALRRIGEYSVNECL
jgi:hypothetical protein